jgi:hypothetical protein
MGVRRKKERRKNKSLQQQSFDRMLSRKRAALPDVKVVKGAEKMSEVILDFAEPLLEHMDEDKAFPLAIHRLEYGYPWHERVERIHDE